jgi:hypothetical protein
MEVVTNYVLITISTKFLARWANACRAGSSAIALASAEVLAEAGLPTVAFPSTIALAKVEAKVGSLT